MPAQINSIFSTVYSNRDDFFSSFSQALRSLGVEAKRGEIKGDVAPRSDAQGSGATVAFVDAMIGTGISALCAKLVAAQCYVVLVEDEQTTNSKVVDLMTAGLIDDVLLQPIRKVELLSKFRAASHMVRVAEVATMNAGIKELIEKFEADLKTARAIQRVLIPEKFTPVQGLKVSHRYLSGLKSGGDYLDFFEFDDSNHIGLLMSDSTGYGLSSAFMSVILKLALKFTKGQVNSPGLTIEKIFSELSLTMKPKENLSLFFGILNRKTFELTYASAGSVRCFVKNENVIEDLSSSGLALIKGQAVRLEDKKRVLNPEDRLVLCSDGFFDPVGGEAGLRKLLEKHKKEDAVALVNDLVFAVKSKFESADDMPEQDCAVMVVDVEKRAMRLAL